MSRIGWFVFLSVQNTTGSNRYFCWKQLAHQLLKDIQISICPYTVEGKITHFAGSEDPDFSFYFILRFEYPLTTDELAVSNKNSDSIPLYFEQTKKQTIRFDIQISI